MKAVNSDLYNSRCMEAGQAYNLELQRNNSKIEDLHSRPKHEIRLQSR